MKIEFYPSSKETELVVPPPRPSAHYIPKWYKDLPKFSEKHMIMSEHGKPEGLGLKSCVPFIDGMINGYIQETWQDLVVEFRNNTLSVYAYQEPQMIDSRGDQYDSPIGRDYYNNEFVWQSPWIPKLPKGWSMMYVHPINHVELPFTTAAGIIDSDSFYHSPFGNFPFYIKYGFTGRIPKGTPMYQMIPIKRESWKSKNMPFNREETHKRSYVISSRIHGAYRELFHSRKEFR